MRKRITKLKRINLDALYPIASANPTEINLDSQYEYYDELYNRYYEDDYDGEFSLEELEELGVISYPETKRVVPDGEAAFFYAIKQGEDF